MRGGRGWGGLRGWQRGGQGGGVSERLAAGRTGRRGGLRGCQRGGQGGGVV